MTTRISASLATATLEVIRSVRNRDRELGPFPLSSDQCTTPVHRRGHFGSQPACCDLGTFEPGPTFGHRGPMRYAIAHTRWALSWENRFSSRPCNGLGWRLGPYDRPGLGRRFWSWFQCGFGSQPRLATGLGAGLGANLGAGLYAGFGGGGIAPLARSAAPLNTNPSAKNSITMREQLNIVRLLTWAIALAPDC